MRKLLVNALNCIIWGEKIPSCRLYFLPEGENQHWAVLRTKMFVHWEWSCVEFVSQCGNFVRWDCSAENIQASGPPCPSQDLWLLGLLFVAGKFEKSSPRSNRIRIPLSPFVAEKEEGLIRSSKNWTEPQTNLLHSQNHCLCNYWNKKI